MKSLIGLLLVMLGVTILVISTKDVYTQTLVLYWKGSLALSLTRRMLIVILVILGNILVVLDCVQSRKIQHK